MKVILINDVKNLGSKNNVVEVSDGYAKNFLFKNKLAVAHTTQANTILQKNLQDLREQEKQRIIEAKEIQKQIEKTTLHFKLNSNKGRAFGEVSIKSIIDQLQDEFGIKVNKFMFKDKQKISLGHQIIKVTIYKDVVANLPVEVKENHE